MRLVAKLVEHRLFEGQFFFSAPAAALGLNGIAFDSGQHTGSLLAAHHANARVRPHPQKAR